MEKVSRTQVIISSFKRAGIVIRFVNGKDGMYVDIKEATRLIKTYPLLFKGIMDDSNNSSGLIAPENEDKRVKTMEIIGDEDKKDNIINEMDFIVNKLRNNGFAVDDLVKTFNETVKQQITSKPLSIPKPMPSNNLKIKPPKTCFKKASKKKKAKSAK